MGCTRDGFYRSADAVFLSVVLLFQSVILNYFIVSHFRDSVLPFFWFLCDFFCLLTFSFSLFLAYRSNWKMKRREKSFNVCSSNSVSSGRSNSRNSSDSEQGSSSAYAAVDCFSQVSRLPLSYVSWLVYSVFLVAKIVVLFKSEIPQKLSKDAFFGPQMVKFSLGVTALIFSLLVEAHHYVQEDTARQDYIKSVSYSVALEILDSTSFLTILIGSESHLVYTYNMENFIIALASVNLMLPAISLYKLSLSSHGRSFPASLGTFYKVLHLLLVNVPYFGFRVYLWQMFGSDVSMFIIKNIYAMTSFIREMYTDVVNLKKYYANKTRLTKQASKVSPGGGRKSEELPMGYTVKPVVVGDENGRL